MSIEHEVQPDIKMERARHERRRWRTIEHESIRFEHEIEKMRMTIERTVMRLRRLESMWLRKKEHDNEKGKKKYKKHLSICV